MAILVNSISDVRLGFDGRYILVNDHRGDIRVVSGSQLKELASHSTGCAPSYVFASQKGGPAVRFQQPVLKRAFTRGLSRSHNLYSIPIPNAVFDELLEKGIIDVITATANPTPTKADAYEADEVFTGGYVIGTVVGQAIEFASKPKVHTTAESAEAEANRLANQVPGKEFVVLKATMSAVKAKVATRTF